MCVSACVRERVFVCACQGVLRGGGRGCQVLVGEVESNDRIENGH